MTLTYNVNLALDFLVRYQKDDGTFNQNPARKNQKEGPYNFLFHLQAVSLLLTAAELFDRQSLRESAHRSLELISNNTFTTEGLVVVYNEKSLTVWNALVAIIYMKLGDHDKASKFLQSVIPCVEDHRVSPIFAPLTSPDEHEKASESSVHDPGTVLLALLMAGDHLDVAKKIGNQMSVQVIRFSGTEAWSMVKLAEATALPFYKKRAATVLKEMLKIDISAMPSLFAAHAQQALLASGEPNSDILDRQLSMQSTSTNLDMPEHFNGAFVRNSKFPEIRIDYTIQNIFALIQYLNQENTPIEILV